MKLDYAKIADGLGADYYTDNGKVIFTKNYLLRRGWCCDSNPPCRHCPYLDEDKETEYKGS